MKRSLTGLLGAAAVLAVAGTALAQQLPPGYPSKRPQVAKGEETGLHNIHSMRKVGRKTCFVDHFHSGSGSGASKREAEASAVASWQSFTDFEYGGSWGSWRNAEAKSVQCEPGGLGGGWACTLNAIPCRPF